MEETPALLATLEEHAPQTRCYHCGSTTLASVCHHCGKAMCPAHSPAVKSPAGKPVSGEFSGLKLTDEQAGAYHCAEHAHIVKGSLIALIAVGIAVAVVGIIVAVASLPVGLALFLVGAGLAIGVFLVDRGRKAAVRAARPPLPLIPILDSVTVLETLHGQVILDENGDYTSPPGPVSGYLDVAMTVGRSDRDRLASYRSKYELPTAEDLEFAVGFAVLKGEAGLGFTPEPMAPLIPGETGVSLRGNVAGHPLFAAADGRSAGQWTVHLPYDLQDARVPGFVPIWFVPSLVPASDQRTLELDVHWVMLGDKQRQFGLDRFEQIELIVPAAWGNVESVMPQNAFISNPKPGHDRSIQWKQLASAGDEHSSAGDEQRGSVTLTIRFEKKIELTDKLMGSLQAAFKGTLSGVEGVGLYLPSGGPWPKPPRPNVKTAVSVDFDLSLRSIRYEDIRVVPDRSKDNGQPADDELSGVNPDDQTVIRRPAVDEFSGVIPDHLTVIDLTNKLSDSGYYVKRVIENPPRGGGRANLVNRYWDIAGRRYDGVFPIDFHLTLTGEEEYGGSIRANAGNTAARITVQGSYVNDRMREQIEKEWDELHDMVKGKLEERELIGQRSAFKQQYPVGSPVPPPAPSSAPPTGDGRAERVAALRKRLDAAMEALLDGRISEQTYHGIRESIEAELGNA